MDMKRRKFLLQTAGMSAASMVGTLSRLGTEAANAQAAAAPYQALVAVFLYGGNDANNMIIPVTNYAQYATVRTAASNVAIPQANLLNFTAASQGGATYGFHPSLGPLQQLYTQGKLASQTSASSSRRSRWPSTRPARIAHSNCSLTPTSKMRGRGCS